MVSSPQPTTLHTPYEASHNGGGGGEEKRRGGGAERTVCGCTLIVFVLSVIVAILAAAVIGLAAGTGIEASLASEANDKYQRLQASVSAAGILTPSGTGSPPPAASTSCPNPEPVVLDNGCSTNSSAVNGQLYTSFKRMYCSQSMGGHTSMMGRRGFADVCFSPPIFSGCQCCRSSRTRCNATRT